MLTRAWAHPRSRGENAFDGIKYALASGSSPLTRGKPRLPGDSGQGHGLIPAHAGKTSARMVKARVWRAHPRSRGENQVLGRYGSVCWGSSPLTRAKLLDGGVEHVGDRLIPAHAGKTIVCPSVRVTSRAHPRSRGENGRGLLSGRVDRGLIPAHAGKTVCVALSTLAGRAHPRSRGENADHLPDSLTVVGSSPLTRGKHGQLVTTDQDSRLIPAHAGKTHAGPPYAVVCAAHPRSRGENEYPRFAMTFGKGSSPLTRGKQNQVHHQPRRHRLIPAHAGKTPGSPFGPGGPGAHPRSRGENVLDAVTHSRTSGSSPLTRGKHR